MEQTRIKAALADDLVVKTFDDYLMTSDSYEKLCASATEQTKGHANTQWDTIAQNSDKKLILDPTKVLGNITETVSMNPQLVRLIWEASLEADMERVFTQEIARLEAQNEEEFGTFWQERLTTRIQLYKLGVDSLEVDKIQSQLVDLLQQYLAKELIPDSINRAESKGLLRSRKTKKYITKVNAELHVLEIEPKEPAAALQSLVARTESFTRKQSIQWLDEDALAIKKDAQVQEMVKSMQKDSNGPRLFLTLVVLLLSRNHAGIVYATGKFAPKLLKLLKGTLAPEQYQKLEKFKDAVKAGSLTEADKEGMRNMAAGQWASTATRC